MHKIDRLTLVNTIKDMIIETTKKLGSSVVKSLNDAYDNEDNVIAKSILNKIIENQRIAREENIPLCQDTGVCVCILEIGRDLVFDYDLTEAINEGVSRGYTEGYLRKSVVKHPLNRVNTKDNTPAIIHYDFIPGNNLVIHLAPKGGGSENMSTLKMLSPADGRDGIIDFVLETIKNAGGKPCPPIIVGIGIGGNFEHVAYLAKKAIFRPIDDESQVLEDRLLEKELLERINKLNVGPMGLGGRTTALAVKVNSAPCHIASLPVAVNLQCHSARKKEVTLIGKKA
ncbi:fumarate hydratase [Candidatus Izemoplasma sp. B36]|uniref:fumarate hydratase n=1 Tax=Candidatus Izemoplasma sp. B36 TaxID=3242468 RepID=UPI00355777A5